jgi:hypothetical protein
MRQRLAEGVQSCPRTALGRDVRRRGEPGAVAVVLALWLAACASSPSDAGAGGRTGSGLTPVTAAVPIAIHLDTPAEPVRSQFVSIVARNAPDLAPARPLPVAPPSPEPGFLGEPERAWVERLRALPIRSAIKGKGGRSLAFKLELQDGSHGYFKPEQSFSGTAFEAEIVAHALDRALGIGRVPPTVGRVLDWEQLAPAAEDDERIAELVFAQDGKLRGALVGWIDGELVPATTPPGWESWVRVERFEPWLVTPFQRAIEHGRALQHNVERARKGLQAERYYTDVPKPDHPDRAGELSDMLLLDFLLLNLDRWGGGNGNVLTVGVGGPLIFLDNAAGLSAGPHRRSLPDKRFFPVQRFRKPTIEALRALDLRALARRLEQDQAAPLLTVQQLEGIGLRRQAALAHVEALCNEHGTDAVLSL